MREPRLAEHFEDVHKQAHAARLGMWVFLSSEVLLFAGLFALYAGYRAMYGADFVAAVGHTNLALGTVNTALIITSSFAVALSLRDVRLARARRATAFLLFAIGCGVAFLVVKGDEYLEHFREGLYPGVAYCNTELSTYGAKMFFTLYYYMTFLHVIHLSAGLVILAWLMWGCWKEVYSPLSYTRLELGALYWSLVDILWLFLWPLLYLMRH